MKNRGILQAGIGIFVAGLVLVCGETAMADTACPSAGDIPNRIAAAEQVLTVPTHALRAGEAAPGQGVVTEVVQFIVARAEKEAEIWLMRSVVANLCGPAGLKNYFTSACAIYNSSLLGGISGISQSKLDSLAQSLRSDVTYAPACVFYENVSTALKSNPIKVNGVDYSDGVASLGYYYTAVATKVIKPVPRETSRITVEGSNLIVVVGGKPAETITGIPNVAVVWSAVGAARLGDYALAIADLEPVIGAQSNSTAVTQALSVAIALASAQNTKDLDSVLDSVVSPIGASVIKQTWAGPSWPPVVVSLTALPGVQIGRDTLHGVAAGAQTTSYGFFLPVGVQVSYAVPWGAMGLLLSPFDAGGLVSYADNSSVSGGRVQSSPAISWKSIEAPGVYLTYSIKNSPFVAGIGYQRSPSLRSVEFSNQSEQVVPATRFMVYFAVDVTLLIHQF